MLWVDIYTFFPCTRAQTEDETESEGLGRLSHFAGFLDFQSQMDLPRHCI